MGAPELLHQLRGAGLVLKVTPAGGLHVAPRHVLTDDHRTAIRAARDALVLALQAETSQPPTQLSPSRPSIEMVGRNWSDGHWDDGDIARFLDRRARLMRWGWSEPDAEALAERLMRAERDLDDRVSCTDCRHYRPGRCSNSNAAGLTAVAVGRDLAGLMQRCPGFCASWPPTAD